MRGSQSPSLQRIRGQLRVLKLETDVDQQHSMFIRSGVHYIAVRRHGQAEMMIKILVMLMSRRVNGGKP